MIILDTAMLAQMVHLVSQANDEIDEAAELMNRVTSHNDWTCKERTSISEGIQRCKKTILQLQESSRSFLKAFNLVLDDMVKKESGIAQSFQGVESLLGKLLGTSLITKGIGEAIKSSSDIISNLKDWTSEWQPKLIDWASGVWSAITGGDSVFPQIDETQIVPICAELPSQSISFTDGMQEILQNNVINSGFADVSEITGAAAIFESDFINFTDGFNPFDYLTKDSGNESLSTGQMYDANNFVDAISSIDFQNILSGMSET